MRVVRRMRMGLVLFSALLAPASGRAAPIDDYGSQTGEYRAALEQLAGEAAGLGLAAEAERLLLWRPADDPNRARYFLIGQSESADVAAESGANEDLARHKIAERFAKLRKARADALFALARRAADARQISQAVAWTYETLREDPNHADAGRVLGLQSFEGRQISTFSLAKHRANQVWHPQFGWLPKDHVARYEAGERYLGGKWISAEIDARAHSTIDRGWTIDTENYRVVTNYGLEFGVGLAERLEKAHQVWRQVFAQYHTSEAEWLRLFAGGKPRESLRRRFNVVCLRNKDEYVAALVKREPNVAVSSSIFMSDDDRVYLYVDPRDDNVPYVFHELTHQAFYLSKPTALRPGKRGNFWMVEGTACYFESLALDRDFAEIGGPNSLRMQGARVRLTRDDFYVPLAQLVTITPLQLQTHPQVAVLYSQMAGLANFLLEADGGKYRAASIEYLQAIYAGKDTPTTLPDVTGRTFAELDAEYQAWIKSLSAPTATPQ